MNIVNRLLISILLVLSTFSGCSCEDVNLNRTCPSDTQLSKPCYVRPDGVWLEMDPESATWNIGPDSQCSLGATACSNETFTVTCEGFVWIGEEICGDNIDNDCDFNIDEGFDSDNDGVMTCQGDCNDEDPTVNPNREEICNGVDDNCDGTIDELEQVECWTGPTDAYTNADDVPCLTGIRICSNGAWTTCLNQVLPEDEICDGIDNDCNDTIDDYPISDGDQCGPTSDQGRCEYGSETCINGESFCTDASLPLNESCNGIDDNCDGDVDENLWQLCSTVCDEGIEFCSFGNWGGCTATQPSTEICDGFDNDCDGDIDEDCICPEGAVQNCYNGMEDADGNPLECGVGFQFCIEGEWQDCEFYTTVAEECNNWDDDCDGIVDQHTRSCGELEVAGIGECRAGTQTCEEGDWKDCEGETNREEEVCNGLDDDCNGLIDDGLDPDDIVDMVFVIDNSGSMCDKVNALRGGIANYVADFQDTEHLFGLVIFPTKEPWDYDVEVWTTPALTDVNSFVATLELIDCQGPGIEPSYDAMEMVTNPEDVLGIGWREDATPYVILMTDEGGQGTLYEYDVTQNTTNCQIGNCVSGDIVEAFVITADIYFTNYDSFVFFDPDRLINMYPVDATRYTELLRRIFQNICIY